MIAAIHQPQYLPWLGYFDKIDRADVFILLDDVQFKKNDWQNRNRIRTPQGSQWLTVPVLHNFGQKISEVKINPQVDWCKNHCTAIKLNYRKAPFFDQYIGIFESAYAQQWDSLVDINIYFIKEFVALLGVETKIEQASKFEVSRDSTQRLVDLCKVVDTDTYLAGADGDKYMDMDVFKASGIQLMIQEFVHPVYSQLWIKKNTQDFLSHMSIVDLLFNCGSKSLNFIRRNYSPPNSSLRGSFLPNKFISRKHMKQSL